MNSEIYIPLLGVFMGWFLNEISQALRRNRENKPYLSQAISSLWCVLFILEQRKKHFDTVISVNRISDSGIEILRFLIKTEKDEIERIKYKSRNAIENLEKFEPFMATEIEYFVNSEIKTTEKVNYDFDSLNSDLSFIKYESRILGITIGKFRYFIKSLSIKHSIYLYIQYLKETKKNKSKTESPFKEIFEKL